MRLRTSSASVVALAAVTLLSAGCAKMEMDGGGRAVTRAEQAAARAEDAARRAETVTARAEAAARRAEVAAARRTGHAVKHAPRRHPSKSRKKS